MEYDQHGEAAESVVARSAVVMSDSSPQRHVLSAVSSAEEEARHLLDAIRELENRLGDVLQPAMDSVEKAVSEPRPVLVPLAERITTHGGTVRMARSYVVSILDRLEL